MELHSTLGPLLFTLLVMAVYCQSGDEEAWGSGDVSRDAVTANTTAVADEPTRTNPHFQTLPETEVGNCYVNFHTSQVVSRRLRAFREDVAYLKALQHGNQAVMENLVQFVEAEMGNQSYQQAIQENIAGIKEDHVSFESEMTKAVEEMESQLEGDAQDILDGIQKIKSESLAFEAMVLAASEIATRLEGSSQSLKLEMMKSMKQPR